MQIASEGDSEGISWLDPQKLIRFNGKTYFLGQEESK